MYKSNPHTARVWHHCWAEIETTTQFYSHPQWGFNKLPENAFYRHSRKIFKKCKKTSLVLLLEGMADTPDDISIS